MDNVRVIPLGNYSMVVLGNGRGALFVWKEKNKKNKGEKEKLLWY